MIGFGLVAGFYRTPLDRRSGSTSMIATRAERSLALLPILLPRLDRRTGRTRAMEGLRRTQGRPLARGRSLSQPSRHTTASGPTPPAFQSTSARSSSRSPQARWHITRRTDPGSSWRCSLGASYQEQMTSRTSPSEHDTSSAGHRASRGRQGLHPTVGARVAQAVYRCRNHSTVRRTASRCAVGSNGPNASWNFEASETNGRSNW